jgi:hypothetical protein
MNEYMNEQQSEGIEEVTDQKITETTFEIDLTDKPKEIIPKETDEVEQTPEPPKRAAWGNRFSFIISAVGASVGFGNFLRFPYLAFQQGGLKKNVKFFKNRWSFFNSIYCFYPLNWR